MAMARDEDLEIASEEVGASALPRDDDSSAPASS